MVPNNYLLFIASLYALLPLSLSMPQSGSMLNSKRYFSIDAKSGNDPRIWPNNKLNYVWASDSDKNALQQTLQDAWKLWTPSTGQAVNKDYIDIEEVPSNADDATKKRALKISASDADGAVTTVGYITTQQPTMVFGNNDDYGLLDKTMNMAHELGHSLGLYHEHEREDRDQHVKWNCENLKDWTTALDGQGFCTDKTAAGLNDWSSYNFIIRPQFSGGVLQGSPENCVSPHYDLDSIMHYPGGAGAKKPLLPGVHRKTVLQDKRDGSSFKKNTKPSLLDITKINDLYSPPLAKRGNNDNVTSHCGVSATYTNFPSTTATVTSLTTTATTQTTILAAQTTTTAILSSTNIPPSTSVAASTPAPVAPYVQGTCHVHVKQWNLDGKGNYDLEVLMTDNDLNQIGYTQRGGPYSDSNALGFQSKLEDLLWCKPENQQDYIAFSAGAQAWPSDGDFADGAVPSCSVGGWDGYPSFESPKREMDCSFVCTWGGGSSSDESN